MFRTKRARSVIHSISHHAVSTLSFLHPKLGEDCNKQEISLIEYDLINGKIITRAFKAGKETLRALNDLKISFEKISEKENLFTLDLKSAKISFEFDEEGWPKSCSCCVLSQTQKEIKTKVDWLGRKKAI